MVRIVAGAAKGRRIAAPTGNGTRPTSDRMREALFSALESMLGSWHGMTVVDLYAGSGAVGFEAASRGAASVVLVESDARAVRTLKSNAAHLDLPGVRVLDSSAERFAQRESGRADVVFADPPYALGADELRQVLANLMDAGVVAGNTVVVVERASRDPKWSWPHGIASLREKAYGEGTLWYGRAAGDTAADSTDSAVDVN